MSNTKQVAPFCDCHIHVFSPEKSYASSNYQPPAKGIDEFYLEGVVDGVKRAVLIQASIDGTDNRYLLDTLCRVNQSSSSALKLRGVVVIDEETTGLDLMADVGIRGIRIQDRTRLGQNDLARLPVLAKRAASMDWHVELNTEPERYQTLQSLLPQLPENQPLVLDHLGHVTPGCSDDLVGLYRLLDSGQVWVKLALTRVSRHIGQYDDLAESVRELVDRYPDRCLWGSDWPHVMTETPHPRSQDMLNFFKRILTASQLEACLSSNPAALYRF